MDMYQMKDYTPPAWAEGKLSSPSKRVHLGLFPTPLHACTSIPALKNQGVEFFIKRDDMTSFDANGNKLRKLEFLMAEALTNKHDCVLTAGGTQSNHARCTAVVARQLGLPPHLMLRLDGYSEEEAALVGRGLDIGLSGNLFFDRLMNAQVHTVSVGTYGKHGGADPLLVQLAQKLRATEGLNPYCIPVGGSNSLGAWGYLNAVEELRLQFARLPPLPAGSAHHIVFASGSGGTAAGLVIGCYLAGLLSEEGADGLRVRLHGVTVCDDPDYFYDRIDAAASELFRGEHSFRARESVIFYTGNGVGYGMMADAELDFLLREVVCPSGIVFDHCYSGKAVSYLVRNLQVGPGSTVYTPTSGADVEAERKIIVAAGDRVVMLHTGGALGSFCRDAQLGGVMAADTAAYSKVKRFDPA
jgi:D-cysteine desulfhydrase